MPKLPSTAALTFLLAASACADRAPEPVVPPPVPILEWSAAVDTLPGTYTRVNRPAEFWDSVLVVPDFGENLLWRIDLVTGAREQIGSRGGGPGEYDRIGSTAKVHRDSVAILYGFAWSPFPVISVRTGRGRTVSFRNEQTASDTRALLLSVAQPRLNSADTLGFVYGEPITRAMELDAATGRPIPGSGGMLDTTPIVRYSINTGAVDTLAHFPVGVLRPRMGTDATGAMTSGMGLGPYGAYNLWTPTADGRLLFVEAAEYRVRLVDERLAPIASHTLPFATVPVSKAGWDAYVQTTTKGSLALLEKSVQNVSAQMGKAMPRPSGPRYVVPDMPAVLPPVSSGDGPRRAHVVGEIAWIPVSRIDPPGVEFWDVVDLTSGERLSTVELPARHYLVLVTKLDAYVVAQDDDDLQRILRYRTPTANLARGKR